MSFPDVRDLLPHREPFLMVDRIVETGPKYIVASRLFREDEAFFRGHFPNNPVVPGVLLVEGIAQTMACLALLAGGSKNVFLVGIDHARFRAVVRPGDEVEYRIDVGEERFGMLTGKGIATVKGQKVADAQVKGYASTETGAA